jgi:hypothetical protein
MLSKVEIFRWTAIAKHVTDPASPRKRQESVPLHKIYTWAFRI